MRKQFGLLAMVSTIAVMVSACGSGNTPAKLNIGDVAPGFQAVGLEGRAAEFPAAWSGKPVVIRFWADWCKYCEDEMKAIDRVHQRLKPRGLEILAVNAGQDKKTIAAFMTKIGVSYPAVMDENSALAKRYAVVGLPTTYFVDASGVVRGKLIGESDEAGFERAALAILK